MYIARERAGGESGIGERSSGRGTSKTKSKTRWRRRCLARRVGLITPLCRRPAAPAPRDQRTHYSAVSWSLCRWKASVSRKTHFSSSSSLDLLPLQPGWGLMTPRPDMETSVTCCVSTPRCIASLLSFALVHNSHARSRSSGRIGPFVVSRVPRNLLSRQCILSLSLSHRK